MQGNTKNPKDLVEKSDKTITHQNSKGEEFKNIAGDILTHLVIHGQHQRAQIARVFRQAGKNPPGTDYIFFLGTGHN